MKPKQIFMKPKFLLLAALLLAMFYSCADDPLMEQLESTENSRANSTIEYYGYSPEEMETVVLPSGIAVGKVGDQYFISDDMALTPAQLEALSEPGTRGNIADFVYNHMQYWPNGIVYYEIASPENRGRILEAIAEYHQKTFIRFIPRQNETAYVIFSNSSSGRNWSYVGQLGGRQGIYLSRYASKATIMHEMAHAVGLLHEHQRLDRDSYVIINEGDYAEEDYKNNYKIGGIPHGYFDFNSLMIYGGIPRFDGGNTRTINTLSVGDINALHAIYGYPPVNITAESAVDVTYLTDEFYKNTPFNITMSINDPEFILPDHQNVSYEISVLSDFMGMMRLVAQYSTQNNIQQINLTVGGNYWIYTGVSLNEYDDYYEAVDWRLIRVRDESIDVRIVPVTEPPYKTRQDIEFIIQIPEEHQFSGWVAKITHTSALGNATELSFDDVVTYLGDNRCIFKYSRLGDIRMEIFTPYGGYAEWTFSLANLPIDPGLPGIGTGKNIKSY